MAPRAAAEATGARTPSLWKRRAFAAALLLQIAIQGAIGAFPLWLVQYKRVFHINQAQTNVVGIALYASVQLVGVPAGGFVVGWGSPHGIATLFIALTFSGYGLLYFVASGALGNYLSAFAAVVIGVALIMIALGILFSLYFSVMTRPTMYGGDQTVFVSGIVNTSLAVGAVASSCLFLFTGLGLVYNLLVIWLVQAAAWPLVTAVVWLTTHGDDGDRDGCGCLESGGGDNAGHERPRSPSDGTILETEPLLAGRLSLNDGDVSPVTVSRPASSENEDFTEPEQCGDYLIASLSTWRYYHATLIMVLKVGIGSTFTTNLGSAIAAALSRDTPQTDIDDKVSTAVLCLNVGQLLGRLAYTSFAWCGGNPNATTVLSVCLVAVGYGACFTARVLLDLTYGNLLYITCAFGFFYGTMWATSGGMYRLAPYSDRPERAFAVIQPAAGFSTFALNTLAGVFYDQHAGADHMCYGKQCYYASDIILAGMSAALFFTAALRLCLGVPDKDGRWRD
mmetsp:Transcript_12707/g.32514  ORF Transcript_12707/g.32514 Transcript_12707/m.32514 type:complete len:508 (-) Transcript_12707:50-1573(-)